MSSQKTDTETSQILILRGLATLRKPSLDELAEFASISRPTAQRKLKELREVYRMNISFMRIGRQRGGKGYYHIEDWGLFDPGRIINPDQ